MIKGADIANLTIFINDYFDRVTPAFNIWMNENIYVDIPNSMLGGIFALRNPKLVYFDHYMRIGLDSIFVGEETGDDMTDPTPKEDPAKPVDPVKPFDPVTPVDPVKPVDPIVP